MFGWLMMVMLWMLSTKLRSSKLNSLPNSKHIYFTLKNGMGGEEDKEEEEQPA